MQQEVRDMWKASFGIAGILYIVFLFYNLVYAIEPTAAVFSGALAGTAAGMFAISFSLSGFAYYFDVLDLYLAYRKYIGLLGFWIALAYSISLCFTRPDLYWHGLGEHLLTWDVLLGGASMAIFTLMALVSNSIGMKVLGGTNWKRVLRLGYLAYAMLALRAYVTEKEIWSEWFAKPLDSPPPARILLFILVVAVILFRLSVEFSKVLKKKKRGT